MKRRTMNAGRWMLAAALLVLVGGCDASDIVRASLELAAAIVAAAT